jgi:hypothetical protein
MLLLKHEIRYFLSNNENEPINRKTISIFLPVILTIANISYLQDRMRRDHLTVYLPVLYNNDLDPFTAYNEDPFYTTTNYCIQ